MCVVVVTVVVVGGGAVFRSYDCSPTCCNLQVYFVSENFLKESKEKDNQQ